jgi:ATP-dependent Clp protease ATP-binding subunit ClpC
MFERYSESARRVLFFARFEASHFGGSTITADHILLGLTREAKGVLCELFALSHVSLKVIRQEIEGRAASGPKTAPSIEMPFSDDATRTLQYAAEEADRLADRYIAPEHLLLGLLRVHGSPAAATLAAHGLHPDAVRQQIVNLSEAFGALSARAEGAAEHVDRIKRSIVELTGTQLGAGEVQQRVEEILRDLEALKRRFVD